jgi:hypothetical protein
MTPTARFRGQLCELVEMLTSARWPDPATAMEAWMKGCGAGPAVAEVLAVPVG